MKAFVKLGKILCRIIIMIILIAVFFWLVHPLLTRFFIPPLSVHRSVSQYTSGQYKRYEDGELFADFTESSAIVGEGEIVAFYHVNNWLQDNPIHGKQCDFFALDIQLSQEEYAKAKTEQYANYGKPYVERDFEVWDWSIGEEENTYFVGFCDDTYCVKLVLVTEISTHDFVPTGFYLYSEIDWKSSNIIEK